MNLNFYPENVISSSQMEQSALELSKRLQQLKTYVQVDSSNSL